MKLNIHYYQHVNYEGLAVVQKWCDENGHNISRTNFKNDEPIPNPDFYDALIVLGGPMSVHDETKYPWLIREKRSIDRALNDGKKVLGICLGAQLLAQSLGGTVRKSEYEEIGWHKIYLSYEAQTSKYFAGFPKEFDTFHWHGEEFSLPNNCTKIASSEICENQIFTYGDLAVGFQCHLEQNEYSIGRMLDRGESSLKQDEYVNSREEIIKNIHFAKFNNDILFKFLDSFLNIEN